jgi:hypothetical protein
MGKTSVIMKEFSVMPRYTFLDYIFGGCEIGVHIAIDFTLSNGQPNSSDSLHYLNPQSFINEYTAAIQSIMGIVQDYDTDQMYPVYGFGGKLPGAPDNAASHCFALNGDIFKPECNTLQGVLNAYYSSLKKV